MEYKYNSKVTLDIPDNVNGHEYAIGFISSVFNNSRCFTHINVYCIANTAIGRYRGYSLILEDKQYDEEKTVGSYNGRLWKLSGELLHVNTPVFIEFGDFKYNSFKVYSEEDLVSNIELRNLFGVTIDKVECYHPMEGIYIVGSEKRKVKHMTRSELQERPSFCLGVNSDTIMAAKEAMNNSKDTYMISFAGIPMNIFTA